ncbi:hypothetical protein B0H10DRAFT_1951595 [Mycena sp. CBHHK59/15]|nr:hypothetical protein B0H10DRAFT_1951595 [Mycena sp. CBHHK59/15]
MSSLFSSPFHRNSLMRTKNYVASSLFASSFEFTKLNRAEFLTEKLSGTPDPDGPAAPDGNAILVSIVSDSKLKVGPIGNWNRYSETTYNSAIEDAKYNIFVVQAKNDPAFRPDFPVIIAALKKLQSSVSKTHIDKWFVQREDNEDVVRFAFNVFEKRYTFTASPKEILLTTLITVPEQRLGPKHWPIPTEYRDALEKIYDTHVVRDFLVFDVDGSRLSPLNIPSKLPGALVECSFGIKHLSFGGSDSFSGLINQIVILRAAQVKPPSPFKGSPQKAYRPPILSPEDVYAQEQQAVEMFCAPISAPGSSTLPPPNPFAGPSAFPNPKDSVSEKRKASQEPEGSDSKKQNTADEPSSSTKADTANTNAEKPTA